MCYVCTHTGTYTYLLSSCAWKYLGSAVSPWPTENETSWWHSASFCVILLPDSILNAMFMTPEVKHGMIKMPSLLTCLKMLVLNQCLFNKKLSLPKWVVEGNGSSFLRVCSSISWGFMSNLVALSTGVWHQCMCSACEAKGFDMRVGVGLLRHVFVRKRWCQTSQDYDTCWWRRWMCFFLPDFNHYYVFVGFL